MKLTKSKLKQLIKEALKEAMSPDSEKAAALEGYPDFAAMVDKHGEAMWTVAECFPRKAIPGQIGGLRYDYQRCADVINMKEDPTFREGACLATSGVRELLNK